MSATLARVSSGASPLDRVTVEGESVGIDSNPERRCQALAPQSGDVVEEPVKGIRHGVEDRDVAIAGPEPQRGVRDVG